MIFILFSCSRFGTWPVAMLAQSKNKAILEGPVCNASHVIGWHTNEKSKRLRRFHVDMLGFAFNSTILWDPKRWGRPFSNPIRQVDTVKEGFQVWIILLCFILSLKLLCNFSRNVSARFLALLTVSFMQETTFIEQVLEDESQMEGIPPGCSRIMNWHLHLDIGNLVYPKGWLLEKNLEATLPIKWWKLISTNFLCWGHKWVWDLILHLI